MQKTLIDYGFTINDDGTIDGTANKLEQLKNTLSETEFGIVSDTLEDYFDTALDTIPELERELMYSLISTIVILNNSSLLFIT